MTSLTWPSNQWPSRKFWDAVEHEIEESNKVAIDMTHDDSRRVVLACWLNYALPAGNA